MTLIISFFCLFKGRCARNAVAGANFGLSRFKITVAIMSDSFHIATKLTNIDEYSVGRLEAGTEARLPGRNLSEDPTLDYASPTDLVVRHGILYVGMELYALLPKEEASSSGGGGGGSGGGGSAFMLDARDVVGNSKREKRALVQKNDNDVVVLGGGLLWCVLGSEWRSSSPVELLGSDEEELLSGVVCLARTSFQRLRVIPCPNLPSNISHDDVLTSICMSNDVGINSGGRGVPRGRDEHDDYLCKYGCGVAVVHVPREEAGNYPDWFDATSIYQDDAPWYVPMLADAVSCMCPVPWRLVSGSSSHRSSQQLHDPILWCRNNSRGGLSLLRLEEEMEKITKTYSLLVNKIPDFKSFFNPEDERRRKREEWNEYAEYVRPTRSARREEVEEVVEEVVEVDGEGEGVKEKEEVANDDENGEGKEEEGEEKIDKEKIEKEKIKDESKKEGKKKEKKEKKKEEKKKEGKSEEKNEEKNEELIEGGTPAEGGEQEMKEMMTPEQLIIENEKILIEKEEKEENKRLEKEAIERAKFASRMIPQHASMQSLFAGGEGGATSMQIKVVLRCRPLFDIEKQNGSRDVVRCTMNDVTVIPMDDDDADSGDYGHSKKARQRFAFERVYGRMTSQQELFEETVRPSIMNAIEGYNVTVFAYGQTGTGKTCVPKKIFLFLFLFFCFSFFVFVFVSFFCSLLTFVEC